MRSQHRLSSLSNLIARFLLPALLLGFVPLVSADAQNSGSADESHLALISLAARAGNFELAQQRLAELQTLRLLAKGNAALGAEYARNGDFETADGYMEAAKQLAETGKMQSIDRVSVLLHISKIEKSIESYEDMYEVTFDKALAYVDRLSGIALDLALVEISYASLDLFGDRLQTYEFVSLVGDERMRNKLISALRLEDLEG